MTSDGKVPVGMVQLKVNGKQCMAKEGDYLAYKKKMNAKNGVKQPKSFYQKALNSKGMKICSRISKFFGAVSYILDYGSDIGMIFFYFLACHENSITYGTLSLAIFVVSFIFPNILRGKKWFDISFLKEFLLIGFKVCGKDPTPEQNMMAHDVRMMAAAYESYPQYLLNMYVMLKHGISNPALQIISLLGSLFSIMKAYFTRHALIQYKEYPSIEQILKAGIVNCLPMLIWFYTDFVFVAAIFEVRWFYGVAIMYAFVKICSSCYTHTCSRKVPCPCVGSPNDYHLCYIRYTINRDIFLKGLLKGFSATFLLSGFFQKPYEYAYFPFFVTGECVFSKTDDAGYPDGKVEVIEDHNANARRDFTYFSSFDDCTAIITHEASFPPLADHFLGLCIFLWFLLTTNFIYLLIEGFYNSRNNIETVSSEYFLTRGINPNQSGVSRVEQELRTIPQKVCGIIKGGNKKYIFLIILFFAFILWLILSNIIVKNDEHCDD